MGATTKDYHRDPPHSREIDSIPVNRKAEANSCIIITERARRDSRPSWPPLRCSILGAKKNPGVYPGLKNKEANKSIALFDRK
jgi:hypothetical protein